MSAVSPKNSGQRPVELCLVPGESELIKASRNHGCCFRSEDYIVVTTQRVQFLWRKSFCGIELCTMEEAFNLDDLQFVNLTYNCGCCCCCCAKMVLSLNFSRHQANIMDWQSSAKISGCKRRIKLPKEDAQEAYNQLQHMLQQRAAVKAHK